MHAFLSTLLNCIPSRVKAWQSSRGQMFPRHFTTKKIRYWISWKINVFSPRKEKKRKERKENDSHPFRYSMRNCSNRTKNIPQAGPTLQLSAIGERETKRRRREREHVSEAKNHAGRNNRSHSTPWYISIHKYTLCTFSKPPFILRNANENHFRESNFSRFPKSNREYFENSSGLREAV